METIRLIWNRKEIENLCGSWTVLGFNFEVKSYCCMIDLTHATCTRTMWYDHGVLPWSARNVKLKWIPVVVVLKGHQMNSTLYDRKLLRWHQSISRCGKWERPVSKPLKKKKKTIHRTHRQRFTLWNWVYCPLLMNLMNLINDSSLDWFDNEYLSRPRTRLHRRERCWFVTCRLGVVVHHHQVSLSEENRGEKGQRVLRLWVTMPCSPRWRHSGWWALPELYLYIFFPEKTNFFPFEGKKSWVPSTLWHAA